MHQGGTWWGLQRPWWRKSPVVVSFRRTG